jgi:hypothetical protein
MIQAFHTPLLLDYIKVCCQLPQDERDQLEAFTGQKYDIDGAAIGNFTVPGVKWVIKESYDGDPIAIGGFVQKRPGVWRDFMMNTPEAFNKKNWFQLTRICRRALDSMFQVNEQGHRFAHRLECIVPAPRLAARPELADWYRVLGYNREATLYGYCANGADAILFSRVRH